MFSGTNRVKETRPRRGLSFRQAGQLDLEPARHPRCSEHYPDPH